MAQGEGKIGGTLDGEEASFLLAWARQTILLALTILTSKEGINITTITK